MDEPYPHWLMYLTCDIVYNMIGPNGCEILI